MRKGCASTGGSVNEIYLQIQRNSLKVHSKGALKIMREAELSGDLPFSTFEIPENGRSMIEALALW